MTSFNKSAVALTLVLSGLASAASAHPRLMSSNPAPNSMGRGSPRTISATFSEPLIANFSGITVQNSAGAVMPIGRASVDPRDRRTLVAPVLRPLAAGGYVVRWRAVSADTHRLAGSYSFRVLR